MNSILASVRRELAEAASPASRDLTQLVKEVLAILPQYSPDAACTALVEADEDVQKAIDLLLSRPIPPLGKLQKGSTRADPPLNSTTAAAPGTHALSSKPAGPDSNGIPAGSLHPSRRDCLASLTLEPTRRVWRESRSPRQGTARPLTGGQELLRAAFGAWSQPRPVCNRGQRLEAAWPSGAAPDFNESWVPSAASGTGPCTAAHREGSSNTDGKCLSGLRSHGKCVGDPVEAWASPRRDYAANSHTREALLHARQHTSQEAPPPGTLTASFLDGGFAASSADAPLGFAPAPTPPQIPPAPCSLSNLADRYVIEGLAAADCTHMRLLRTAHVARDLLYSTTMGHSLWVELYGSLALYGSRQGNQSAWQQDWARHYVRMNSDIDLVVLLREGAIATDAAQSLVQGGNWTLKSQAHHPKFGMTQFTLSGNGDQIPGTGDHAPGAPGIEHHLCLKLSCIDQEDAYQRFKRRQEAFMHTFKGVRANLEYSFGQIGALAFDAYVYLLKGFAQTLQGNAMTGFQATCLGIFCLQLGLFELKGCEPTGLIFFECFLRFCATFFSDEVTTKKTMLRNYRHNALDLSLGARMLPRMSSQSSCEAYFLSYEVQMQTHLTERVNIVQSMDPAAVCVAARQALIRKWTIHDGALTPASME